jgi:transposase-like protein
MAKISYRRHRFPSVIIQHAVWLYLRFTLSYRDVEELLAERGLDISYETVRCWVLRFGPMITRRLRRRRSRPSNLWHLDEMVIRIAGERMYSRAVEHEGAVLDMLVQRRRDSRAALRLMRKLLKKQGFAPKLLTTDKLRSYAAALRCLRLTARMSRDCGWTIEPKTRIRRCDDESTKCSGSSQLAPPSAFLACTPPFITPSTFNATSSRARRSESSEPRRRINGEMRLPPRDHVFRLMLPSPPQKLI